MGSCHGAAAFKLDHLTAIVDVNGLQATGTVAPCLKPFPEDAVREALRGVKAIVIDEEHSVIGGLSAALSWALRGDGRPMEAVAVMDVFGQSAQKPEELMEHYGLTAKDIGTRSKKLKGLEKNDSPCSIWWGMGDRLIVYSVWIRSAA